MMKALTELLSSKKFLTAIAGALAGGLLRLGFEVPIEDVMAILSPLVAAIVGQGIADHGKEKAKIELAG